MFPAYKNANVEEEAIENVVESKLQQGRLKLNEYFYQINYFY